MNSFKTVIGKTVYEITEKRSKFIATLAHTENEEQAIKFISEIKTEYWNAKHNVYAYSLNSGNIKRFSDDGEPHGTAGKPVLDVLSGAGIENAAIVVTRYFGGILLGTGGLVRAYSSAAQGAIDTAVIKTMTECLVLEIICDYSMYDTLMNFLKNISGGVLNTEFTTEIKTSVYVNVAEVENFISRITDIFGGKVLINTKFNKFFPI